MTQQPPKSLLNKGQIAKQAANFGDRYLTSVNGKLNDIEPLALRDLLKEMYETTTDDQGLTRVCASILNAIFHQKKLIFYFSRDRLKQLLVSDPNASKASLGGRLQVGSIESLYTRVLKMMTGIMLAPLPRRKLGVGRRSGKETQVFILKDEHLLALFLEHNPEFDFAEVLQSWELDVSELPEAVAKLLSDANVVAAPVLLVESVREALFTAKPTYTLAPPRRASESAPPAVVVVEEEEPEVKWVPAPRRTPEQDRVYHQAFNDITTDLSKTLGLSREIIEERLAEAEKCISGELGAADSGLVITKLRRRMSDFYRPTITKNLLPCQK